MRLLQVTIPTGKRDAVLQALDDEGVDYVVTDETSGREFTAVVYAPLPTTAVEPVIDQLRGVGVDDQAYTVVLEASTVISRRFEQLEDRYAEDKDEDRIAREELRTRAEELAPTTRTYVVMTIVSAIIATAGLLLDSPAVVVGSMVIAPLIGPAMAAAVGTVIDDREIFQRGVKLQIGGMLLAVVSAAAFAFFVRTTQLVPPVGITTIPEIQERLAPDFLSLAVALGAGIAGAISLASGVSAAIVGVMIAVALIPPAATVGIGLAYFQPMVSFGSGVLALVNLLSINLAALVVLWYQGYRPEQWFRLEEARNATLKRIGVLVGAIGLLSIVLGLITVGAVENATTEDAIQRAVEDVVSDSQYEGASVINVEVGYGDQVLLRQPEQVTVTVGVPPDQEVTGLAARIDERVDEAAGRDVRTQVQYFAVESA